ncbi:MAG: CapA family protein [Acetatifactor sp.]|nr:CapA family protein [Acetatifactor sp.]
MKKLILWVSMNVILMMALGACSGNTADDGGLPLTSTAIGGQESAGQGTADTEKSEGAVDVIGIPIPTREPVESSEEILQEPETEEHTPDILTVTISAAGDCSLGNHQEQEYAYSFRQAYDQIEDEGYFFENVRDYFAYDDMTIVNFEGVLTFSEERDETRTYNIKGDPEYARLLTAGSVESVSFANNHRLDYGTKGSDDTVAALEAEDIVYAYDRNVGIYETEKGIRIGIVSVNEVAWGLGSEQLLADGIGELQEQGVDLILACCHWGIERDNYPTENQKYLGRKCIDLGADLVIGHHPHVLQGVEEYNGRFIIYSLANFCFGANRNPADKDTMIFQQTFTFVDGVKQMDQQVQIIPCSVSSIRERNNFQPTPVQGEEAARIIGRINTYSEGFGTAFAEDGTFVP